MSYKNILHTIKSTWLCIKYPFLYPRNRFTGKHHNNWKLHDIMYGKRPKTKLEKNEKGVYVSKVVEPGIPGLYQKAYVDIFIDLDFPDPDGSLFRHVHYVGSYWHLFLLYCVKCIDYIDKAFHVIPTYNEWESMPAGWNVAFGQQMLDDLKAQLKKDKMLYDWRIMDLKEKNGALQLDCNFGSKELYDLLSRYEDLSYKTCITCGKPATKLTGGWVCPYCDDCFPTYNIPYATMENGQWKFNEENI